MQRILRYLLLPLALLFASAGLVACGGGDDGGSGAGGGKEASADTDVNTLLDQTFAEGDKKVDSGKIDLKLNLNVSGDQSLQGPVEMTLGGAFQNQGAKKLPKFDMNVSFSGAGQNIKAGALSTGEKGFINFNGQEYAVSEQIFSQFKQGFEQAAAQGNSENQGFASLGINPKNWLENPKVEGDSDVGGTATVKITGGVNISKMLDDVNTALEKAGSLGLSGQANLPTKLTDQQKQQVADAVKDVSVEIETGKDDSILRRMAVKLAAEDPAGSGGKADIEFDISLTELNEDQSFEEPSNTKPFEELLSQFGGLGGLGALGGSGAGGSSGSGSGASGADAEKAQKYAQCVQDAGSDTAKAQECASILAP